MSQKPSAAEATMGPNMRHATSVNARMEATAAHGSRPRAARHCSVSQPDTDCCACTMALMSMAPISTTAKTIT